MRGMQRFTRVTHRLTNLSIAQRVVVYVVVVAAVVTGYTAFYWYGMAAFEDRHLSWAGALQTVAQSLTTTGYGQDAPWDTAVMNLFTILMQVTGILLVFLALPLFVVPWFRQLLERRRFDAVDSFEDHVVISGHTPVVHAFIREIESHDHTHPYVIVEPDRERAARLHDRGHTVLCGDPETESTLRAASAPQAWTGVVAGDDQATMNVALALREVAPELRLTATLTDATLGQHLRAAGVEHVVQPRRVVGQALATRYLITAGEVSDRTVVLGHGTVGATVRSALETWGVETSVVDVDASEHVDVVGDATRPETLAKAGIDGADAVVVSLPDDQQAVYATVLVRDRNPDAEVFVRATGTEAVSRLERAGADYVLELPDVSGRMLAAAVLDEPIEDAENDILFTRVTEPDDERTTAETGRIVGVARGNELHLDPGSEFELRTDDVLIYARR